MVTPEQAGELLQAIHTASRKQRTSDPLHPMQMRYLGAQGVLAYPQNMSLLTHLPSVIG